MLSSNHHLLNTSHTLTPNTPNSVHLIYKSSFYIHINMDIMYSVPKVCDWMPVFVHSVREIKLTVEAMSHSLCDHRGLIDIHQSNHR